MALVFTSTVIFWTENKFHVMEDLKMTIRVYIIKEQDLNYNWRHTIIYLAHTLPAVALAVEMSMSRLRMPLHHVLYTLLFVTFYLLITYIYEVADKYEAINTHVLNWKCKFDWSYIYRMDNGTIMPDQPTWHNCSDNMRVTDSNPLITLACVPMYPYYCKE